MMKYGIKNIFAPDIVIIDSSQEQKRKEIENTSNVEKLPNFQLLFCSSKSYPTTTLPPENYLSPWLHP
jgi:hypothetical protein